MHAAAQRLLGRHDFTSFRAASCQAKSPIRTLDRIDVTRFGDIIEVVAEARSFLHHQVRNFVGTLKLVGEGRWSKDRVTAASRRQRPSSSGSHRPADGLTLVRVGYPENPFDAQGADENSQRRQHDSDRLIEQYQPDRRQRLDPKAQPVAYHSSQSAQPIVISSHA